MNSMVIAQEECASGKHITETAISFIDDTPSFSKERPYLYLLPREPNFPMSNCAFSSKPTRLLNFRTREIRDDFEQSGFTFVKDSFRHHGVQRPGANNVPDDHLTSYLQSMQRLVRAFLKADLVVVFDWRFRLASRVDSIDDFDEEGPSRNEMIRPAYKAHADLSPEGGWMTVKAYLKEDELAEIANGTYRATIVTCWRPLVPKIVDCPLAFCKRGTVASKDIIAYDRVDGSEESEGAVLKWNAKQEWYWLPHQTWDEMSFFQSWDSQRNGYEAHSFHAAFWDHSTPEGAGETRRSLEVRAIAMFKRSSSEVGVN